MQKFIYKLNLILYLFTCKKHVVVTECYDGSFEVLTDMSSTRSIDVLGIARTAIDDQNKAVASGHNILDN